MENYLEPTQKLTGENPKYEYVLQRYIYIRVTIINTIGKGKFDTMG